VQNEDTATNHDSGHLLNYSSPWWNSIYLSQKGTS